MSRTGDSSQEKQMEPFAHARSQMAHLLRSNEILGEEALRLPRDTLDLMRRLRDATLGIQADREIRRATLNLLEDAVAFRQAEQQENIERRRVEQELREADRRKD